MKALVINFKFFTLFAWLFYSASSYAIDTFSQSWRVYSSETVDGEKIFDTTFLEQRGDIQQVTYSIYNTAQDPVHFQNAAIDPYRTPIQREGPSVVRILADCLTQGYSQTDGCVNLARQQEVSFNMFPIHWLTRFSTIPDRLAIDTVHHLAPGTVYVNLRALNNHGAVDQTTETPSVSEAEPVAESNTMESSEGLSNESFAGDVTDNNPETTQDSVETETPFEIGVIFRKCMLHSIHNMISPSGARSSLNPYWVIVVNHPLDDESVISILEETAEPTEGRVYFEANLDPGTINLLPGLAATGTLRSQGNSNIQSSEHRSARRRFLNSLSQFFQTCFFCCFINYSKRYR